MLAVFTEFERLTKRPLEEQGCQADNRECDAGDDDYPQELVPTHLHLEPLGAFACQHLPSVAKATSPHPHTQYVPRNGRWSDFQLAEGHSAGS